MQTRVLLLTLLLLLLLSACGGGGGCAHLSCAPDTGIDADEIHEALEDAEDGLLDEGESPLGDALIDAVRWLLNEEGE